MTTQVDLVKELLKVERQLARATATVEELQTKREDLLEQVSKEILQ